MQVQIKIGTKKWSCDEGCEGICKYLPDITFIPSYKWGCMHALVSTHSSCIAAGVG